jgi:hypothetical protein
VVAFGDLDAQCADRAETADIAGGTFERIPNGCALFFNTANRLVHHARRTIIRLASNINRLSENLTALLLLPLRA